MKGQPARLRQGRRVTREESLVLDYQLGLERFVDASVPGSREAFTMAHNAIRWLILREPGGLEDARRWLAWKMGFNSPDSDAVTIVQIEWHVRMALGMRRGEGRWGDPEKAPEWLHRALLHRFEAKSIPSVESLASWLDRHAERHARGKITTAGIVAKIVHEGRLLGARLSEQRTRERVTKALDRKRHPRW